jgi:hypothetical protein
MPLNSTEHPLAEMSDGTLHSVSVIPDTNYLMMEESTQTVMEPTQFRSHFVDQMELHADAQTVAEYFDAHHAWFRRCAHPMAVEPIGQNGYALVIGQFGSFGYEVEPKIGLDLLPQAEGIYRIETIPIPNYETDGYDVDFQAAMELLEVSSDGKPASVSNGSSTPTITRVQWQLDLTVSIQFPRFIHALPKALVQSTGDRLLHQIVRQVSNRLTHKVLEDFHTTYGLTIPKRSRRWFFQKNESNANAIEQD